MVWTDLVFWNKKVLGKIKNPPSTQTTWRRIGESSFLYGTGIGLFIWSIVFGWIEGLPYPFFDISARGIILAPLSPHHMAWLFGSIMVICGMFMTATEPSKLIRNLHIFRDIGRSWISRQFVFSLALIILGTADTLFIQSTQLQTLIILLGIGGLLSQGFVLSENKKVSAWNVAIIPLFFVVHALTTGYGAVLLFPKDFSGAGDRLVLLSIWGLIILLADLILWSLYLATPPKTEVFKLSVRVLKNHWKVIVLLGHIVPVMLIVVGLLVLAFAPMLHLLTGIIILGCGFITNHILTTEAAYLAAPSKEN